MSDKIAPAGRRLGGDMVNGGKSKYAGKNPNAARESAKRLADLEKARDELGGLLNSYIQLLTDKVLPTEQTASNKKAQQDTLEAIPRTAALLDSKNLGEGSAVVFSTCLSSILVQPKRNK